MENKGKFQKGRESWNKGTKGICKANSGSFGNRSFIHPYRNTKGVMKANKTSFKKGIIAWNKGKKGLQIAWNRGLKLGKQ